MDPLHNVDPDEVRTAIVGAVVGHLTWCWPDTDRHVADEWGKRAADAFLAYRPSSDRWAPNRRGVLRRALGIDPETCEGTYFHAVVVGELVDAIWRAVGRLVDAAERAS